MNKKIEKYIFETCVKILEYNNVFRNEVIEKIINFIK